MKEVVIVSALRSSISEVKTGQLAYTRPDYLLAGVFKEVLARTPQMDWLKLGDILVGCNTMEGEQGLNIARHSAFMAGIPSTVPAVSLNRGASSSISSIMLGTSEIMAGFKDVVLAGGVESMTRIPEGGYNPSPPPMMMESHPDALTPPGVAAETIARKYKISREKQDDYALDSHEKARKAWKKGLFATEIAQLKIRDEDGRDLLASRDSIPKKYESGELESMQPKFLRGGTITEGNSAPMADGAAVVLLMSKERADILGVPPLAYIRGCSVVGCQPDIMHRGLSKAANEVLKTNNVKIEELSAIEISEQFSASALACIKDLEINNTDIVNKKGGAIALGFPIGANGARIVTTLVHSMDKGQLGLACAASLGGQGEAILLEKA